MNPTLSILTGASRGLGRAVAEQLLERGHQVISVSRQPPQGLVSPQLQHWAADLADAAPLAARAVSPATPAADGGDDRLAIRRMVPDPCACCRQRASALAPASSTACPAATRATTGPPVCAPPTAGHTSATARTTLDASRRRPARSHARVPPAWLGVSIATASQHYRIRLPGPSALGLGPSVLSPEPWALSLRF